MNRTFYPNPDTYEQPPTVAERAADERYANEFNTIVVGFRIARETMTDTGLAIHTARLCGNPSYALSHEKPVLYFMERWGFPAVLRALAKAIEQPINPSAPLVGD